MYRSYLLAAALVAALSPQVGFADEAKLNDLTVIHPMAFETAKTARAGAGYMAISNDGDHDDRLIAVRADFPRVMIHNTEEDDGIARMVHIDAVDLPAGETVMLEPGGMHVMFMGLNGDPFEVGEEIPATLIFEKAGALDIVFKVEKRLATGQEENHSGHGDHSGHDTKKDADHSNH